MKHCFTALAMPVHSIRIWIGENPDALQQVPFHSQKVGLWCVGSLQRIIAPLFFNGDMNSDLHVNDKLNPFFK
jgi:hypothetical protein